MKSLNFTQMMMIFGLILVAANPAFARNAKQKGAVETKDNLVYSASASTPSSSSSGDSRFSVGYAFAQSFTGTTSSVTGMLKFSDKDLIQVYFGIPTTSPFEISAAANYKRTISESQNAGFHIGGGVAFGALPSRKGAAGTAFSFAADALAGFHFNVSGASHVQIHVDGGPVFSVNDGESLFSVSSVSPVLGASLVYWF